MTISPDEQHDHAEALATRFHGLFRVFELSREFGMLEGQKSAYEDICEHIGKALASAEEELARAKDEKRDAENIVIGQILALTSLASHFSHAPPHFEDRLEQLREEHGSMLKDSAARLRALAAQYESENREAAKNT